MPLLRLADVELFYEAFGSGPPMLLLSATVWSSAPWKLHQVPEFARDHSIFIFDQRGVGRSVTTSKDFSTARLVEDALALLNSLEINRAIVLGHSKGGRVAQLLAADRPGKGAPVELCLELVEKGYERATYDQFMRTGFSPEYGALHPDRVEALRRVRMEGLPRLEVLFGRVVGRRESDTTSRLKDIRAPTLVMVGSLEADAAGGEISHFAFADIPVRGIANARGVALEGQGHYCLFVEPEARHRLIQDFLRAP